MYKSVLLILLAVGITSAFDQTFLKPKSESSENIQIKLYFYDTGRSQNLPIKLTDTVDSFIKQNGPKDELLLDGVKLELGKTWGDYGAGFDSTLVIKRGKTNFRRPPRQ